MFFDNIIPFIPLILLLVTSVLTRRISESMIAATLLALLFLHKGNFISGTIDAFYDTLSDSSFQFAILLLVGFGAFIQLLQDSGAMIGFRNLMLRFADSPKKTMVLAWVMSAILFIDEYLNALTVTFALRDITDQHKIPREHLAFQAHAMACSLCIVVPVTSWTAFTVSLISEYGMTFQDYIKAVPLMFFPLLSLLVCLLIATGACPKVGLLKQAYQRIANGGPSLLVEGETGSLVDFEMTENQRSSSAINAIIPLAALIGAMLYYDNDLIRGLLVALLLQFILYVGQKIMTIGEYFKLFFEGAKSMTTITIVLGFGFTLSRLNKELGMFDILIGGIGDTIPGWLLPVLAFLLVGLTVFAVGGCWVVMLVAIPIFLSIASATGVSMVLILAAVMSGIGMGFSLCFYADTVFMTTAGTGVSNLSMIKATLPYAIVMILISCIGYLACGIIM